MAGKRGAATRARAGRVGATEAAPSGNGGSEQDASSAGNAADETVSRSQNGEANPSPATKQPTPRPKPVAEEGSCHASEATEFYVPADVLEEEERLRIAREEAESKPKAAPVELVLGNESFKALETLLNKSQLYTQFLAENMASAETEQLESEAKAPSPGEGDGPVGKKRKAAGRTGGAKKKAGKAAAAPSAAQELCPGLVGELRDYQLRGIRWLASLFVNGINGILADQMGLGKTVQTIGMLCHLRGKAILGPYLVLGPLSTLHNWVSEFQRWAPDFPALLYHGSKAERAQLWSTRLSKPVDGSFPVVVTSYEILLADIRNFQKVSWKYLVVDEGHRLKNHNCRLIRELRTLRVDNKLLLTGTPLQNNLTELWSLLNFILPEAFSSLSDFESWFESMADAGGQQEDEVRQQTAKVVEKLHAILKPFLLRRVKSDVETSLPGKLEVVLYAQQSAKQQELNKQLKDKTLREALSKSGGPGGTSLASLNNMLMQLRKNCNHPDLITAAFDGSVFFPPPEELVADCGKMALLEKLLNRLLPAGHKTLIFSQMTSMLDVLSSYLEARDIKHCRLDGSVSWQDRQEAMKLFTSDPEHKVFLLSTRAGGLGINLTAADTCIIYDSDWNPQQDLQAMDRCHRIGQRSPVLVLRLASARSVEGKLLERAARKLQLERMVIKSGAFLHADDAAAGSMSKEELLDVISGAGSGEHDLAQSGDISDEVLDQLLDRSHLEAGSKRPYPDRGIGYEVVHQLSGSGLLAGVE